MHHFTPHESIRYFRHFSLEGVGIAGQVALKKARVICIGAGGLGCPVLLYLAAAGVGTLGIVDGDSVGFSDLHRQIIYHAEEVGTNKAVVASAQLAALNPHGVYIPYPFFLTTENAYEVINSYDIVVDCTDNFSTRYLLNDACCDQKKPNVHAAVLQFDGQATVFTADDSAPCYRCLYPSPPPAALMPSCKEAGVLGVLPGILGSLQAMQVLHWILHRQTPLSGKLLVFEGQLMRFREFTFNKNDHCPGCSSTVDKSQRLFTHIERASDELTYTIFKLWQNTGHSFFLIDVREPAEHQVSNLGGTLIPLGTLAYRLGEIPKDRPIVIYCAVGNCSRDAVHFLKKAGFNEVFSLAGGLSAAGTLLVDTASLEQSYSNDLL